MKKASVMASAIALFAVAAVAGVADVVVSGQDASGTLDAAAKAMGIDRLTSIEYTGSGSSYNLGQAVTPGQPWPRFVLRSYTADIDYTTPAWRQEMDRTNPDGSTPFGGNRSVQVVSGNAAWNIGANNQPAPVPANVAERQLQIVLTPPGFIKAALANRATVRAQGANKIVAFTTPDKHRVTGVVDGQNMVTKIETTLDNPVLGDMPVEATFSDYKAFGGIKFPTHIVQKEGGHPFLDLTVSNVKANAAAAIDVPASVRGAAAPPVRVETQKLGDGIWYLTGGSHHSLVVEFTDHLVVVEAPLNEERSNAVIAEAHKLAPSKPIRYVINTHVHFDHSGGLRSYVAEGATIVTAAANKPFYEKALAAPHTLNPDKEEQAKKKVTVEGVAGKRVLTDGSQTIELDVVQMAGHNDAMLLVYLPTIKTLSEADAFTPPAANAPPQAGPNPGAVELYDQIQKLKLDVRQIAPIHGRLVPVAELQKAAGKPVT
jgi:glyoxylase-like metal-dependent hydrolase (beta-lactamase superfamily II)